MSRSRAHQLHDLLADGSEITIVCHNNPDPDCLASALALGRIAAGAGIDEPRILYSGDISHQQNRAFVNLLDMDLQRFDAAAIQDRPTGSLLAFVDHSVPGANNPLLLQTDLLSCHGWSRWMPEPQYEYDVEPFSLAPSELENAKLAFNDLLNDRASNGWVLDETLRIDASSFFLIFRRPLDE